MTPGLLKGLCFTRGDGAEVWIAVHHQLLGSWKVFIYRTKLPPPPTLEVGGGEGGLGGGGGGGGVPAAVP